MHLSSLSIYFWVPGLSLLKSVSRGNEERRGMGQYEEVVKSIEDLSSRECFSSTELEELYRRTGALCFLAESPLEKKIVQKCAKTIDMLREQRRRTVSAVSEVFPETHFVTRNVVYLEEYLVFLDGREDLLDERVSDACEMVCDVLSLQYSTEKYLKGDPVCVSDPQERFFVSFLERTRQHTKISHTARRRIAFQFYFFLYDDVLRLLLECVGGVFSGYSEFLIAQLAETEGAEKRFFMEVFCSVFGRVQKEVCSEGAVDENTFLVSAAGLFLRLDLVRRVFELPCESVQSLVVRAAVFIER
ncbi:MAG: uncharacterized protein A8A55_2183 [Amphiamblys sp. WSBS2006]|nr:MAG: uncharacterized protein A8A55_2183 [Amphiamblys sp. WSBS2006]